MEHITSKSSSGEISVELAARRTGMSFQRTRMSADRTLMSVIRTSLALIGFGFTIFQFFEKLHTDKLITSGPHTTRHFGITLVALGILMLIGGIAFHSKFMLELRKMRGRLQQDGLIHGETSFPVSLTLITALLLLLIGVAAIVSMLFQIGPFG
jgi:putative membrane protein